MQLHLPWNTLLYIFLHHCQYSYQYYNMSNSMCPTWNSVIQIRTHLYGLEPSKKDTTMQRYPRWDIPIWIALYQIAAQSVARLRIKFYYGWNTLVFLVYNSMKANPDKFQFMILGPSGAKCFILKIKAIGIRNTSEVELLDLTIDHKLEFDAHINKSCKTAKFKLHTLRRIKKF